MILQFYSMLKKVLLVFMLEKDVLKKCFDLQIKPEKLMPKL